MRLTWSLPQGEALKEFVVEKSTTAVGGFKVAASSQQLEWLDDTVAQGETCYYRVAAVDLAGNRSGQERTIPVTVPFFDEVALDAALSGNLIPGSYKPFHRGAHRRRPHAFHWAGYDGTCRGGKPHPGRRHPENRRFGTAPGGF